MVCMIMLGCNNKGGFKCVILSIHLETRINQGTDNAEVSTFGSRKESQTSPSTRGKVNSILTISIPAPTQEA